MNRTPLARRVQIINCLVEGNSIRSTERMTDTHRDTIMRLLVEVGSGCAKLMDESMRDLPCRRIQVDEIWAYVGKKQAHLQPGDNRSRLGDMWTFVALDPDTKLIPTYRVGKRTSSNAVAFMTDLSERLSNRVQLSSDSLNAYVTAVERAFGIDVDYGQEVKFYDAEPIGPGRYAPPKVSGHERAVIVGRPGRASVGTIPHIHPHADRSHRTRAARARLPRRSRAGGEPLSTRPAARTAEVRVQEAGAGGRDAQAAPKPAREGAQSALIFGENPGDGFYPIDYEP